MEPYMHGRHTFALSLPLRPCLRPFLAHLHRCRQNTSVRRRLGTAAGLAAAGLAAAGGTPPLQPTLLSGAMGGGAGGGSGNGGFGDPSRRVTDVLLVLNVAIFGLQLLTKDMVTLWGIKINKLIVAGQYWRLLTPAFLHGSLMHLAVNSHSLNNLGPFLEELTGHRRFCAVYVMAALAGNVASFLGSPNPALGASGAIFGIGGALGVFFYRNRDIFGRKSDIILRSLGQTLLINLIYGLSDPRIDNWGHMGGMLGGALVGFLLGPHYKVGRLAGRPGTYLVDSPPLPLFRSSPKQLKGW